MAFARRTLRQSRIGHTGTLDPFATGVLPLACGRATRLVRFMSAADKIYEATVRLGLVTDTYDTTGTEVSRNDARASADDVAATIASMQGEQLQIPPPYSAKRIGGKRAYDLARQQTPVALAPARVTLYEAEILGTGADTVSVRLRCSAGYYVRSFAHDLGSRLGIGACLATLRRTASGHFTLADTVTFQDMDAGRALAAVLPIDRLLPHFAGVRVNARGRDRFQHGQTVRPADVVESLPASTGGQASKEPWTRIVDESGALIGIGSPWDGDGTLRPHIVLI